MKTTDHRSKEDLQTIADEAAAEKAYQEEKAAKRAPKSEAPPPITKEKVEAVVAVVKEVIVAAAKPPVVAPEGARILRQVDVQEGDGRPISHYYVVGTAPPYSGAAMWIDLVQEDDPRKTAEAIDRRLRRA